MAHEFTSGFSVREPMWHRLGTVLDDYPGTWDEARIIAGLDWEPELRPLYNGLDDDGNLIPNANRVRVVRDDTQAELGTVQAGYGLLPNADLGPIVEAVLDQDDVKYETTVVLQGGRKVCVVARVEQPLYVLGDTSPILPYAVLMNAHDGSMSAQIINSTVRVVCMNTWKMADMEGRSTGRTFRFRHTGTIRERIAEARDAILGVSEEAKALIEQMTRLAETRVDEQQTERYLDAFRPLPKDLSLHTDRVIRNVEATKAQIREILHSDTTADVADTAYGWVQATGEYLDYVRAARSAQTAFTRSMIEPETMKTRAVKLAREVASVG